MARWALVDGQFCERVAGSWAVGGCAYWSGAKCRTLTFAARLVRVCAALSGVYPFLYRTVG